MAGRKTKKTLTLLEKLTDEVIASVAESVRIGLPYSTAMELEGFFTYSHQAWGAQGEKDLALGVDTPFARLVSACTKARAEFRAECISALRSGLGGVDGWKAAMAILERSDPQWMKRESIESTHTETNKTYVVVTNVPGRINSRTEMPRLTFADKHPAVTNGRN